MSAKRAKDERAEDEASTGVAVEAEGETTEPAAVQMPLFSAAILTMSSATNVPVPAEARTSEVAPTA